MWWLTTCLCCLSFTLVAACPPHCYCYSDDDGLKTANCSLVGLHHGGSAPQLDVLNFRSSLRGYHTKLEPRLFATFKSIKILNLVNSSIVHLPNDVFQGLTNVLEIDLSYNKIRHLNGVVFKDLPSLSSLSLRGNLLVLSPFDVIVSKTLDELDMGYCGLNKIPPDTFKGVPNLAHLTLDGNQLHTFTYHTLPSGLRYLNIAYNRFIHVPTDVFLSMRSLRRINLSHNPVNCTCQLLIFQDRFSDDGRLLEKVICASPPQIEGKKLSRVNENHICRMEMLAKESQLNSIKHSELRKHPQDQPEQADQPWLDDDGEYSPEVMFTNNETSSYGTHQTSSFTDSGTDNKVEEPDKYSRDMKEATQDLEGGSTGEEFDGTKGSENAWTEGDEEENDNNAINSPSTLSDSAADPSNNVHALDVGNRTTHADDPMIAAGSTIDQIAYEDDPSNNTSDYSYDAQHPEYASSVSLEEETQASTVPASSRTAEEVEETGSGDGETSSEFDKNSSPPIWMEEQENETSTVGYKIEEVTHIFNVEPSSSSPSPPPSTEEPTTLVPSSTVASSPSSEPSKTPITSSSTTEEPSSSTSISTTSETEIISTTPPSMVEILQNDTVLQKSDNIVTSAGSEPAAETGPLINSAYVYGLAVVAVLLLLLLIMITMCRRRNHAKIRLPQDAETNFDTEMQDMLLPKPPENGIKVLPKNFTNGKSASPNGKLAEEEATPILASTPPQPTTNGNVATPSSSTPPPPITIVEDPTDDSQPHQPPPTPPPSTDDWPPSGNLQPEPIETVKARMTVLARPQTPIYIHKTLN